MYVVVSKWEFNPAEEETTMAAGAKVMEGIAAWEGVEDAFNVRTGPGHILAVIKYRDEATYDNLINSPDGPFEKLAAENGIENAATWLWSERGHVVLA